MFCSDQVEDRGRSLEKEAKTKGKEREKSIQSALQEAQRSFPHGSDGRTMLTKYVWLVVWNMNFIFHILGMSSSQLTNSYFSEG